MSTNQIKPARKRVISGSTSNDPNWYVTFEEDVDIIHADKWDKWVAVALGIAVLIVVALDSAWLTGWLP